jgi:uncharacterized protein
MGQCPLRVPGPATGPAPAIELFGPEYGLMDGARAVRASNVNLTKFFMSLKQRIDEQIKAAMKAQDKGTLQALRSIKSKILLAETAEGQVGALTEEAELKVLAKEAKQRRDSAAIYEQQGRTDLLAVEQAELAVIERFLPKMLAEDELKARLTELIGRVGATSAKDMGKVMGLATKELAGQADGKAISAMVKTLLA